MKKMTFVLCACLIFFALGGCADSVDGRIESAKFSLDRCDPDDTTTHTNCTSAITTAEEVIASNADNMEAYLLASSGYFGRAGLNLLELVETFSDLTDSETQDDYVVIANTATIAGDKLTDLASAETTLSGSTATFTGDAYFQLGVIQAAEAFVLPISRAKSTGTVDVSLITAEDRSRAEGDFVSGDDNLITAEIDADNELVQAVRENFCRLSTQAVGDVAGQAFSLAQQRDQIGCALDDNYAPSLDYNADGAVNRTDCSSFDPGSAAVTACKALDTAI